MNLDQIAQRLSTLLNDLALQPLKQFLRGLDSGNRPILYALLATAAALGFALGRRRTVHRGTRPTVRSPTRSLFGAWRFPTFQNRGEARVSRILLSHFGPPDHHLLNHVTLRMEDGTTQVDHILVSRGGVFVIETKDYNGWIFGSERDATWTQLFFPRRFTFQNPIRQNHRHVRAVQYLLDFLPPEAIHSVVVFSGTAEFKTDLPLGVVRLDQLVAFVRERGEAVMSRNRLQFCVGRLETSRLAISRKTDVEHIQDLARRFGDGAA